MRRVWQNSMKRRGFLGSLFAAAVAPFVAGPLIIAARKFAPPVPPPCRPLGINTLADAYLKPAVTAIARNADEQILRNYDLHFDEYRGRSMKIGDTINVRTPPRFTPGKLPVDDWRPIAIMNEDDLTRFV